VLKHLKRVATIALVLKIHVELGNETRNTLYGVFYYVTKKFVDSSKMCEVVINGVSCYVLCCLFSAVAWPFSEMQKLAISRSFQIEPQPRTSRPWVVRT
jgi:hypothetical protein